MKLALLTHYLPTEREDYTELAAITVPQRNDYCKRHDYQHIVYGGPYADPALYYAVQRLYLLHDQMVERRDVDVFWVLNVQGLLTNLTKPVIWSLGCGPSAGQANLYFEANKDFAVAHDCHGLNAGSFLVRNSEWGRAWIKLVADQSVASRNTHAWHEQKILQDLTPNVFFRDRIQIVPQRSINSYLYELYPPWNNETLGDWRSGDLVLSLPGLTLKQRLEIVRSEKWQGRIVK